MWALAAFSLAFASYAGFRVLAKVGEPPLHSAELTPSPPEAEASAAIGAAVSQQSPSAAHSDPPQPAADGLEPAVVAIRSNPSGAMVIRNGQKLGETPISLLVRPSEPFVRVELQLAGYQPLAAELTAKDGERTLKLTKEALTKPVRKTRIAQRAGSPRAAETTETAPTPGRKTAHDGYERFE
jgi:hypothetical protein